MSNSDNDVKKILIVEDEPVISDVCRRVLTADGFEVDIAANGRIAQDMVGQKRYDICLIDIRTPTMNGKELYGWLKEWHPQLANRAILTSGDLLEGDTKAFIESAGRLFLPKPFSPGDLKAIVAAAWSS